MVEFRSKLDNAKSTALNNRAFKKLIWFYLLLSAVLLLLGILAIVLPEDDSDLIYGIVCIVFGVLITPFGYLLTRLLQKRNDNATVYISSDTEEVYTFDEQYITITQTRGDLFFATTKAKYAYIHKAYEDKNYYYLYISKMQSHVIDKSSLTKGSLEELNAMLKYNLGDKFKSK